MSSAMIDAKQELDKNSALPLHGQLKEAIIANVRNGRFATDAPIPSERDLCDYYDVSRTTVRKAIADLTHEGWLYVVTGKGTFVASRPLKQKIEALVGFNQAVGRQGLSVVTRVLAFSRIEADDALVRLLKVRPGSAIIRLARVRCIGDDPIAIQTAFIPEHLCPGILSLDFSVRSLYDVLRTDYNHTLASGHTAIEAGLADDLERQHLGLADPSAILRTEQITLLDDETPIELCRSSFHVAYFSLHVPSDKASLSSMKPL
jgi:GntR family transcriptional regulator